MSRRGREEEELQLEVTYTDSITSDHKEKKKLLGVIYGTGMNVNNIIGAGIFTTPGIVWKQVKSPSIVIILWLIGGIVSLCGSLIYTEYGAILKDSGGETIYLATAYPKPYKMASYLFSFMFIFIIRPGIVSAVLQSAAQYMWYMFEGKPSSVDTALNGWNNSFKPYWILKLIAIGLLFSITTYHLFSNKWANRINHTLAIIKMVIIMVIALGGMARYHNNPENWKTPVDNSGSGFPYTYSIAIIEIFFTYNGWNALNYSLDEFRNPEKKLKLSNLYSVGIVTLLYLMVNIAFITVVPFTTIMGVSNEDFNEIIAADFFKNIFNNNETAARVLSFFVVLSATGAAATNIWSGSRVIVSAAKSDFFPFFSRELGDWHNSYDTPFNALCTQFIWCTFFILVVGSVQTVDVFILFTSIAIFSSWIFYIATSVGLVILRKKRATPSPFKVPLSIVYFFILSGFMIIILSFFFEPMSRSSYFVNISFILTTLIALIVGCLAWYVLFYRFHLKEKSRKETAREINTQVRIQIAAVLGQSPSK